MWSRNRVMKQHITTKQLNELSEKGKESLRKWWYERFEAGDRCVYQDWGDECVVRYDKENSFEVSFPQCSPVDEGELRNDRVVRPFSVGAVPLIYPLLSVGQMIEFLDENWEKPFKYWYIERGKGWWFSSWNGRRNGEGKVLTETKTELCNALWEATKDILEK